MTLENKELLLKDLSIRLPYVVKGTITYDKSNTVFTVEGINNNVLHLSDAEECYVEDFKPYLRPLSSMTEEEKKDILQSLNIHGDIDNEGNLLLGVECDIITLKVCKKYLGELNKRMFDVCHMIEKGLALEAPEGMYTLNK